MKFSKKTAAAVLMAALSTGAYAQVTQAEFNKLKDTLFSEEAAVDRDTNQPIVDENGDGVFKGVIPALVNNLIPALAEQVQRNEEIAAGVFMEIKKNVDGVAKESGDNKTAIQGLATATVGALTALEQKKAETSEIERLDQSIAVTDDNVATLFDKTNANEDKISDLDQAQAKNAFMIDVVAQATGKVLNELEQSIADTDENVDHLYTAVNDHDSKILALDVRQAENRTVLLALANTTVKSFEELDNAKADKKEIDAVYDSIAITDDNVQELYDVTNEHEAALLALDEKQAANAANIEILTDVKADKEYVDNNLTNIIGHVNNATNVIGQEVGKVKDATNTNKAAIANLDGRVEIAEQAIKVVGETLNETGLAVIEGFKDHRGRISTVAQNVAKVNDRVTRTRTEVKDLQANKANKTDVDALATTVAAKADKAYVDENFAKKADSTTVDAGLATKADKVEVAALGNRVSELDSNLKSGLAANAALNGLFQPYNVGKVNVTAALGGYKSTTALAIGAGYRVNENFAAKAGIATALRGDSGFTYNLGVNYEF